MKSYGKGTADYIATLTKSAICKTNVKPRPNPSIFYFPGLNNSQPIYDPTQFTISSKLIENYDLILKDYNTLLHNMHHSDYVSDDGHKLHQGKWDWNSYILKGKRQVDFAVHCSKTVDLLESSLNNTKFMSTTPFSFTFFSTLYGSSKIDPHYGPCNLRLRCHFPLIVPEGDCGMNVGGKTIHWKVGEPVFFDDCYEHHVWNNTNDKRVLLLFDIWHPDLSEGEMRAISNMFEEAKQNGWLT